ncbi:MAG: hypothetical protein ACI971_001334 [Colwellia sp.]|jgi:hypothetical protein
MTKYVRKETVTITKTEEFNLFNEGNEEQVSNARLASGIWKLIKKHIFSIKWIGGKDG